MLSALFLMLAAPEAGAVAVARASATILSGEEIELDRLEEEERDQTNPATSIIIYNRPDEEADGTIREFRVIEFQ